MALWYRYGCMILGDATIGNTTVGFSTSKVDLSLSATATSAATLNTTLGKATNLSSTSTSDSVIFNRVDLSTNASVTSSSTFDSVKGVQLSFGFSGSEIGDFSLGDATLGYTQGEPTRSVSTVSFGSAKGRTGSFTSNTTSKLSIFRKINLILSSAANTTTNFVALKGVNVQAQSTATSTVVFVPKFEEIVGRTRADGERVFIIQAEGNID